MLSQLANLTIVLPSEDSKICCIKPCRKIFKVWFWLSKQKVTVPSPD